MTTSVDLAQSSPVGTVTSAPTTTSSTTTTVTIASTTWTLDTSRRVEAYYLRLLNCTRTGGWVRSDGSCSGYGSGRYSAYRTPLRLSSGISTYVSRPYAKYIAVHNLCTHFANGDPGYRLRRAGYRSYRWAENIGCNASSTNAYKSVLASHLYFQREKYTGGGHWVNIKNSLYTYVGIGVWRSSGRVRLVVDFYRP